MSIEDSSPIPLLLSSLSASLMRRNPTARRNGMRELLDGDRFTSRELTMNLHEIRLINRGLGWTGASLRAIDRLVHVSDMREFSFLDVATGSGDLPLALLRRARRQGWRVHGAALDASPAVLSAALRHLGRAPVALHQGDARMLPFPDRAYDLVICALALHHFSPDDAVAVLRELARVSRRAWLVVDLERSFPAYLGACALRLLLRSPLTLHDAPASVLRSYSRSELRALLDLAGLHSATVAAQFPFRLLAYDIRR